MSSIKIAAVGDMMFGDQPLSFGFGVRSKYEKNGYDKLIRSRVVHNLLLESDLVIGNFESSFDTIATMPFDECTLSSTPAAIKFIKELGFSAVSLANNHTLEHGNERLNALSQNLESNGIAIVGTSERQSITVNRKEKKIVISAYSAMYDYKNNSSISIWNDDISIAEIKSHSKDSDYIIVIMHWGNEFMTLPSPSQINIGRKIIDAGANLVLGSHSHTIQPVEYYKHGCIAYSMGNFVFDNYYKRASQSAIFVASIEQGGAMNMIRYPININQHNYEITDGSGDLLPTFCPESYNADIMSQQKYNKMVFKSRLSYRFHSSIHVLLNLGRYKDKLKIVRWIFKRALIFLTGIIKEYRSPEAVYR